MCTIIWGSGISGNRGELKRQKIFGHFRTLYASSYLAEENSQKLLSYLSDSPFDNYIQSGLPQDIAFSHKIGVDTEKKVYLDSGIIYAQNRPYLLTVMTKIKTSKQRKK